MATTHPRSTRSTRSTAPTRSTGSSRRTGLRRTGQVLLTGAAAALTVGVLPGTAPAAQAAEPAVATAVAAPTPASQAAVDFALAQVGKGYAYGGNGPDAYDCSGLTTAAYAAAGVSLPRTSSAQSGVGIPVDRSALQPGDLVFYYSPVSHVGIYVGNDQIVNSLNSSTGVIVSSVDMPGYAGASRVA